MATDFLVGNSAHGNITCSRYDACNQKSDFGMLRVPILKKDDQHADKNPPSRVGKETQSLQTGEGGYKAFRCCKESTAIRKLVVSYQSIRGRCAHKSPWKPVGSGKLSALSRELSLASASRGGGLR